MMVVLSMAGCGRPLVDQSDLGPKRISGTVELVPGTALAIAWLRPDLEFDGVTPVSNFNVDPFVEREVPFAVYDAPAGHAADFSRISSRGPIALGVWVLLHVKASDMYSQPGRSVRADTVTAVDGVLQDDRLSYLFEEATIYDASSDQFSEVLLRGVKSCASLTCRRAAPTGVALLGAVSGGFDAGTRLSAYLPADCRPR